MAHPKANSNHAKAIIPHLREAVDSRGQRYKVHDGHRALIGPDTIIVSHGMPPLRMHQHLARGAMPREVEGLIDNRHPGHIAEELVHHAHKELPLAHQSVKREPQQHAPMSGPRLPMGGR